MPRSLPFHRHPSISALQSLGQPIPSINEHPDEEEAELKIFQTCLSNVWEDLSQKRESLLNLTTPQFCGNWKVLQKLLAQRWRQGPRLLAQRTPAVRPPVPVPRRDQLPRQVAPLHGPAVRLSHLDAGGVRHSIASVNNVVFDPHLNPVYD